MSTSGKIYTALINVMRDVPAIAKAGRNQQQGFSYRGIDDVYNSLNGVMAKHGVIMCPEILSRDREERINKNGTVLACVTLTIRYTFYAEDGSSVSCVVSGEGMDSGDKATSKALSIAHKYALFQVFLIPTAEIVDPDAESHEVQAKKRHALDDAKTRTAFFDAIKKTVPHLVSDKAEILNVLGLTVGREVTSTKDLTNEEILKITKDPSILLGFAPTVEEYTNN